MQNKVYLKRTFNCSPETLFKWLVEPELIVQWFGPKDTTAGAVATDVRLNGRFSIELTRDGGQAFTVVGQYSTLEPPHRLGFSFGYQGIDGPESEISMILTSQGKTTTLQFTQSFETPPPNMEGRTVAWNAMFALMGAQIEAQAG